MDRKTLEIFQREVKRQCRFAIIAVEQIQEGLGKEKIDFDLVWYAIQSLLIAMADISKLFWPPDAKREERGKELRESLGVGDDSPLQLRTFRNHFEHFDERLEDWATSSERHNFIDTNIGPIDSIGGGDTNDYIRNFDPNSGTLHFRGDKYELKPLVAVIHALYQRILVEVKF